MRFTTLLNYHLIYWLIMQCLLVYLINCLQVFCYSNLTWETSGFELTSTITLVLQANGLTKVLVTPNIIYIIYNIYVIYKTLLIKIQKMYKGPIRSVIKWTNIWESNLFLFLFSTWFFIILLAVCQWLLNPLMHNVPKWSDKL